MRASAALGVVFLGLIIVEEFAHLIAGMRYGHLDLNTAAQEAFRYTQLKGYLFISCFRFIPYVALSGLVLRSKTAKESQTLLVAALGLIGLWACWFPLTILVFKPFYTPEHVSSTSAIAHLFIPIYSIPSMLVGYFLGLLFLRDKAARAGEGE